METETASCLKKRSIKEAFKSAEHEDYRPRKKLKREVDESIITVLNHLEIEEYEDVIFQKNEAEPTVSDVESGEETTEDSLEDSSTDDSDFDTDDDDDSEESVKIRRIKHKINKSAQVHYIDERDLDNPLPGKHAIWTDNVPLKEYLKTDNGESRKTEDPEVSIQRQLDQRYRDSEHFAGLKTPSLYRRDANGKLHNPKTVRQFTYNWKNMGLNNPEKNKYLEYNKRPRPEERVDYVKENEDLHLMGLNFSYGCDNASSLNPDERLNVTIYGRTIHGNTVAVRARNFYPYLLCQIPKHWSDLYYPRLAKFIAISNDDPDKLQSIVVNLYVHRLKKALKERINAMSDYEKKKIEGLDINNPIIKTEIIKDQHDLYSFKGLESIKDMLEISVIHPCLIPILRDLIGYPFGSYMTSKLLFGKKKSPVSNPRAAIGSSPIQLDFHRKAAWLLNPECEIDILPWNENVWDEKSDRDPDPSFEMYYCDAKSMGLKSFAPNDDSNYPDADFNFTNREAGDYFFENDSENPFFDETLEKEEEEIDEVDNHMTRWLSKTNPNVKQNIKKHSFDQKAKNAKQQQESGLEEDDSNTVGAKDKEKVFISPWDQKRIDEYKHFCRKHIETALNDPPYGMRVYEANIKFVNRVLLDCKIKPTTWIKLPKGSFADVPPHRRKTISDYEYELRANDMVMENNDKLLLKDMPKKELISPGYNLESALTRVLEPSILLAFDGEMEPGLGVMFPIDFRDRILQFGCHLFCQATGLHEKYLFCVGKPKFAVDNVEINDVKVFSFEYEDDMLKDFAWFFQTIQPQYVTGWNSNGFDLPYYYNRCRYLGITEGLNLGQDPYSDIIWRKITIKNRTRTNGVMEGVVVHDLMNHIMADHAKFSSSSLNYVCNQMLDYTKIEFSPTIIHMAQRTPEGRGLLATYCNRDVQLLIDLIKKDQSLIKLIEKSRIANVPVQELLNEGMMHQVFLGMLWEAKHVSGKPYRFPTPRQLPIWVIDMLGKVPGAHVNDPDCQYSTGVPIYTKDAASLYPSIMMAWNLCFSTQIEVETAHRLNMRKDKDYKRVLDYKYNEATNEFEIVENPDYPLFVTREYMPGFLPEFELKLKDTRKEVKREMGKYDAIVKSAKAEIASLKAEMDQALNDVAKVMKMKKHNNESFEEFAAGMENAVKKTLNEAKKKGVDEGPPLDLSTMEKIQKELEAAIKKNDEALASILSKLKDCHGDLDEKKKNMKEPKFLAAQLNMRQNEIKVYMNSIYGFMGAKFSKLRMEGVAFAITAFGRFLIVFAGYVLMKEFCIENGYPFTLKLIYGDTDSVFMKMIKILKRELWDMKKDEEQTPAAVQPPSEKLPEKMDIEDTIPETKAKKPASSYKNQPKPRAAPSKNPWSIAQQVSLIKQTKEVQKIVGQDDEVKLMQDPEHREADLKFMLDWGYKIVAFLNKKVAEITGNNFVVFEFEKVFISLLLMKKKKYSGKMYEIAKKDWVMGTKGFLTERKDSEPFILTVIKTALKQALDKMDRDLSLNTVKDGFKNIHFHRAEFHDFILSKALSKRPSLYTVKAAHVKVAEDREKEGEKIYPGQRIPYVIVKDIKKAGAGKFSKGRPKTDVSAQAMDAKTALENGLPYDENYYCEKLVQSAVVTMGLVHPEGGEGLRKFLYKGFTKQKTSESTIRHRQKSSLEYRLKTETDPQRIKDYKNKLEKLKRGTLTDQFKRIMCAKCQCCKKIMTDDDLQLMEPQKFLEISRALLYHYTNNLRDEKTGRRRKRPLAPIFLPDGITVIRTCDVLAREKRRSRRTVLIDNWFREFEKQKLVKYDIENAFGFCRQCIENQKLPVVKFILDLNENIYTCEQSYQDHFNDCIKCVESMGNKDKDMQPETVRNCPATDCKKFWLRNGADRNRVDSHIDFEMVPHYRYWDAMIKREIKPLAAEVEKIRQARQSDDGTNL